MVQIIVEVLQELLGAMIPIILTMVAFVCLAVIVGDLFGKTKQK